ncbi:MAG: dUTP diphosphatase [Chthonomonadales bacterium]|nr:dUTP diphosphatase [Chthonomonadales bacterium]
MDHISVQIVRLPHALDMPLPAYATASAAGMDLRAAVDEPVTLAPGARCAIPTGIAVALPEGYEAQIRPRSGLALEYGVSMANTPGTIDADYRGEIRAIMVNLGEKPFVIRRGDRIAQMVVGPVARVVWHEVGELPDTERGAGGFGHTGR